jgi:hypothetical protein
MILTTLGIWIDGWNVKAEIPMFFGPPRPVETESQSISQWLGVVGNRGFPLKDSVQSIE